MELAMKVQYGIINYKRYSNIWNVLLLLSPVK